MKDKVDERLILLATAQEYIMNMADIMEQWDKSQFITEKNAFDSMIVSDKVLNMSKEGSCLIELVQECYQEISVGISADKYLKMSALLEEIKNLFRNINEASATANDISHRIEGEVAFQKEIEEDIKNKLTHVGSSLEYAVACAEFMLDGQ